MAIQESKIEQEDQILREGSFAYYKNKCEQQTKYIKTLESANSALLESMERLNGLVNQNKQGV